MFAGSPDMFTPETHEITDTDPLLRNEVGENIVDSTMKQVSMQVMQRVRE